MSTPQEQFDREIAPYVLVLDNDEADAAVRLARQGLPLDVSLASHPGGRAAFEWVVAHRVAGRVVDLLTDDVLVVVQPREVVGRWLSWRHGAYVPPEPDVGEPGGWLEEFEIDEAATPSAARYLFEALPKAVREAVVSDAMGAALSEYGGGD